MAKAFIKASCLLPSASFGDNGNARAVTKPYKRFWKASSTYRVTGHPKKFSIDRP
jgi:hypothetical protein